MKLLGKNLTISITMKYLSTSIHLILLYLVWLLRYNIEQEQKLALETTVLVEQYTVSDNEVIVLHLSFLDGSLVHNIHVALAVIIKCLTNCTRCNWSVRIHCSSVKHAA